MANDTHFIVFFRLGWETVESSIYIVEHELDFLSVRNSPRDLDGAICNWLRFLTRPSGRNNYNDVCIARWMVRYYNIFDNTKNIPVDYNIPSYLLWMDCFDFSMKSVSVVGCKDGSSSQSSGSRSEICCKLPILSSCRTGWLLLDPGGPPEVYKPPWPGCEDIPAVAVLFIIKIWHISQK